MRQVDHEYRFNHEWARVPRHVRFGITHGVDIDTQGFVHILHTVHETSECRDCVAVFSPDGDFVRSWGEHWAGSAHGLHIVREGADEFAYVTDLKRGLFKTTLNGEIVWHIAKPAFFDKRPHLPWEPTNVAVTPAGDVFLADGYGSYLIFRFDPNGKEIDCFGGPGLRDDRLSHPHGLIYTERLGTPALLVAENIATRLNYLSLDGRHLGFLEVETRRPRHFDEHDGTLIVPDFYGRLTLIGPDDRLMAHLGDGWDVAKKRPRAELESRPPAHGEFIRPHDAVFDDEGNIYVTEYLPEGRVTKLTRE